MWTRIVVGLKESTGTVREEERAAKLSVPLLRKKIHVNPRRACLHGFLERFTCVYREHVPSYSDRCETAIPIVCYRVRPALRDHGDSSCSSSLSPTVWRFWFCWGFFSRCKCVIIYARRISLGGQPTSHLTSVCLLFAAALAGRGGGVYTNTLKELGRYVGYVCVGVVVSLGR